MQLAGIMLGSDNPQQLAGYYTKLFGKPSWQQKDWSAVQIGTGG